MSRRVTLLLITNSISPITINKANSVLPAASGDKDSSGVSDHLSQLDSNSWATAATRALFLSVAVNTEIK